jgi:hypothetical protein
MEEKMDKYVELTSKGKNEYLKVLENIGWFNFSSNTKDEINNRLNESEKTEDFMFCLYDLWFDTEGFEDSDDYRFLLEQIMEIIKLTEYKLNVEYIKQNDLVKIKMETKNSIYTHYANLIEDSSRIEDNVINEFINNKLLVGENTGKKFIQLPSSDQTIQFVYMPGNIFQKAIENGIIPEEDYFRK